MYTPETPVIPRPHYLDALNRWRDSAGLVKVITGVRRCGKSSLLQLFRQQLLADGVPEASVVCLNFESLAWSEIDSHQALNAYVEQRTYPEGRRYILLDEVQLVPQWERAVNSLRLDQRNDIYLTGSNARLLTSQLASLLSGRYVQIEVFPLSFAEIWALRPSAPEASAATVFNEYLTAGGLPGQFLLPNAASTRTQYIDGVLSTIIAKDIVAKQQVRDVDALQKILRFLSANVGNLISVKGISDYMTSAGRRIAADTVDNYLRLLEEAYLFYRARREDLKDKTVMKTNDKFYLVDLGFRQVTAGPGASDVGRSLENVVYFELRRRYPNVSVGKLGATEVDFVAFDPSTGPAYFQVAQTMADDATRERELRPLQALRDSYPKTILSLDEVIRPDYAGIRHENVIEWLTN